MEFRSVGPHFQEMCHWVFFSLSCIWGRGNVGMRQWERGPSGAGGTNYEESGAQTRPVKYVLRVLRA